MKSSSISWWRYKTKVLFYNCFQVSLCVCMYVWFYGFLCVLFLFIEEDTAKSADSGSNRFVLKSSLYYYLTVVLSQLSNTAFEYLLPWTRCHRFSFYMSLYMWAEHFRRTFIFLCFNFLIVVRQNIWDILPTDSIKAGKVFIFFFKLTLVLKVLSKFFLEKVPSLGLLEIFYHWGHLKYMQL